LGLEIQIQRDIDDQRSTPRDIGLLTTDKGKSSLNGKTVPNKAYSDTKITKEMWLAHIGPGNPYPKRHRRSEKDSKRYRATYDT
jgi:hypothetical protein